MDFLLPLVFFIISSYSYILPWNSYEDETVYIECGVGYVSSFTPPLMCNFEHPPFAKYFIGFFSVLGVARYVFIFLAVASGLLLYFLVFISLGIGLLVLLALYCFSSTLLFLILIDICSWIPWLFF